jgi:hypothetical protein
MKLLHRLRSMGPGVENPAERDPADALPGMSRDDFLDPPSEEAFEPALGSAAEPSRGDHSQR